MSQNDYLLFVGALLSVLLFIGSSFVRFRKRELKTEKLIRKSKRISWMMMVLGIVFFLLTLWVYFYLEQGGTF